MIDTSKVGSRQLQMKQIRVSMLKFPTGMLIRQKTAKFQIQNITILSIAAATSE
jgi:hypothetical protein